jgi:hypothetical protein
VECGVARGRCRGTADSVGTLRGVAAPARSIHICSSRTCRGRKVPRWNPAPQETLPLRGHPREQTVKHVKTFERSSGSSYGSSSSSRSTGLDRGRLWRSQAAQTWLIAAAGRPLSPLAGHIPYRVIHRHIHRHAGHLRGVAGAASRVEGGSRAYLGVQGAADADRRRRFGGLASAGALWAPRHSYRTRTRSSARRVDVAAAAAVVAAISVQSQPQFQLLQL